MVELSATHPINIGKIAPPTIAITRIEDPFFVRGPRPSIPSANIVGNITDMNFYVNDTATTETHPRPATTRPIVITFMNA
jgi:hypothetical protein